MKRRSVLLHKYEASRVTSCDVIRTIHVVSAPGSQHRAPKTPVISRIITGIRDACKSISRRAPKSLGMSWMIGTSLFSNEETFGGLRDSFRMRTTHKKTAMIRNLEVSALPPTSEEGRGAEVIIMYQERALFHCFITSPHPLRQSSTGGS